VFSLLSEFSDQLTLNILNNDNNAYKISICVRSGHVTQQYGNGSDNLSNRSCGSLIGHIILDLLAVLTQKHG